MLMRISVSWTSAPIIAVAAICLTVGTLLASAQTSAPQITQTIPKNASPGVQPGQGVTQGTGAAAEQNSAGNGQQVSTGRQITLQDAFMLAERQNLDLAAARLQRAVAQAGIRIAGERPNPTVSFSATRDTPHESAFFDQPLEVWGQRGRRIDQAKQELSLTEIEIATTQREVRKNIREAYYSAALARAFTLQQTKVTDLAHRLRDIAKARFDAGDIPQLEVMQADVEVAKADADLEVTRQEERVAFSKLSALLNEPSSTQWAIGSPLETAPTAVAMNDVVQRAVGANYDILHLQQEANVERSKAALLRAERMPEVSIEAGADFNSPPDFQVGARGQLTIGVPIFNRNQGELAQSAANLAALEGQLLAKKRSVTGDVEAAFYDLASKQTQVSLYRDKVLPAAQQVEALAEESYRAGRANILEVLNAQKDVQQTEHEYLQALFDLQQAFAELEELVGVNLD